MFTRCSPFLLAPSCVILSFVSIFFCSGAHAVPAQYISSHNAFLMPRGLIAALATFLAHECYKWLQRFHSLLSPALSLTAYEWEGSPQRRFFSPSFLGIRESLCAQEQQSFVLCVFPHNTLVRAINSVAFPRQGILIYNKIFLHRGTALRFWKPYFVTLFIRCLHTCIYHFVLSHI